MGLANIFSMIKNCPPWHLLNQADELRKIVVYIGAKPENKHEILCGAALAEQLIFSALNGWLRPSRATEDNRFDYWCLSSYLHHRQTSLIKPINPWQTEKWHANEILLVLLALYNQRDHEPGTLGYELLNFLEGWADFLISEIHSRRTMASG